MDASRWSQFLTSRLRSQISLENGQRAQSWAFAFLSLFMFATALKTVTEISRESFLYGVKYLFLVLFHLIMAAGFYLPTLFLEKGQRPASRILGIKDLTSLVFVALSLTFYSVIILSLSFQTAGGAPDSEPSAFAIFLLWANVLMAGIYAVGGLFAILSFTAFPNALAKAMEKSRKLLVGLFFAHLAIGILMGFGFSEVAPIGSPEFFEQFRAAGLFWIFIAASTLFVGRILAESHVSPLAALELEVVTGRLTRAEDILVRFKDVFTSRRLVSWLSRLSHVVAEKSHQIAKYSHDAVAMVGLEKPSELDLRQVEERSRRAESVFRNLEKENQRFLISLFLFDLNEAEREKAEFVRDQFSRELRNAKLELASVRKRIDERLTSIKNLQIQAVPSPPPLPGPSPAQGQGSVSAELIDSGTSAE